MNLGFVMLNFSYLGTASASTRVSIISLTSALIFAGSNTSKFPILLYWNCPEDTEADAVAAAAATLAFFTSPFVFFAVYSVVVMSLSIGLGILLVVD